ncbi:MAG: hypothetical protein LBD53_01115 [Tannerella sp.]|jgi:uncharacterized protein YceK|nr:hypothetical protein [Tannerella sp.]
MKGIILILSLLLLCLSGCRSVSKSTELKSEISEKKDVKVAETVAVSSIRSDSVQLTEHKEYKADIDETVIETEWSAPDSIGRQYPVKTVSKTVKTAVLENSASGATVSINSVTDSVVSRETQDASITEIAISEKETKKKTNPLPWLLILPAAGIIAMIYKKIKQWI